MGRIALDHLDSALRTGVSTPSQPLINPDARPRIRRFLVIALVVFVAFLAFFWFTGLFTTKSADAALIVLK